MKVDYNVLIERKGSPPAQNEYNFINYQLHQFLPLHLANIVLIYLGSHLLNSAMTDNNAFSLVGPFLNPEELKQIYYINKYFSSIFPQLISQHYLLGYNTLKEEKLITANQLTRKDLMQRLHTLTPSKRVEELFNDWLEPHLLILISEKKDLTHLWLLLKAKLLSINLTLLDTPLIIWAIKYERIHLLSFLLQQKADLSNLSEMEGDPDLINYAFNKDHFSAIRILQPHFGLFSIPLGKTCNQETYVMQAVKVDDIKLVNELLKTCRDEINMTFGNTNPLVIASLNQNVAMLQLLFAHGAKIELKQAVISPIQPYVRKLQKDYQNCIIGEMPQRNITLIKDIFDLLLNHGDNLKDLSQSCLSEMFQNDDYALLKEIILRGVSIKDLSIFEIYHRLKYIFTNSKKIEDWDLLKFWLHELLNKLPSSLDDFLPLFEIDPDLQSSLQCHLILLHLKTSQISYDFQQNKGWDKIEIFVNELHLIAKELCTYYKRSKETDSKSQPVTNFASQSSQSSSQSTSNGASINLLSQQTSEEGNRLSF